MKPDFMFSWGDAVRVIDSAASKYRPGNNASICGLREISDDDTAKKAGFKLHSNVYLVEYSDGTSLEIEEEYLELIAG